MSLCPCPGENCVLSEDDPRHGTISGYTNKRCRCDPCRENAVAYNRQLVQKRRTEREQAARRGHLMVVTDDVDEIVDFRWFRHILDVKDAEIVTRDREIESLKKQLSAFMVRN